MVFIAETKMTATVGITVFIETIKIKRHANITIYKGTLIVGTIQISVVTTVLQVNITIRGMTYKTTDITI